MASLCTNYLQIFHGHDFVPHEAALFASDGSSDQAAKLSCVLNNLVLTHTILLAKLKVSADLVKIPREFMYHLTMRMEFWIYLRCAGSSRVDTHHTVIPKHQISD
jgi:hypothetical protein